MKREKAPQALSYQVQTSEDPISSANICLEDEKELKEIRIKDLKPGVVIPNSILYVRAITQPT